MEKRERRTILTSGNCEKGFTLIEVLVALTVVAVAFTILFETLSSAGKKYEEAEELFEAVLRLDAKLKLGDHEGVEVKERTLPDFPRIKEKVYSYRGVFFIRYEGR